MRDLSELIKIDNEFCILDLVECRVSAVYGKGASTLTREKIEEDTRVTQYLGKDKTLIKSDVSFHSDMHAVTRNAFFVRTFSPTACSMK